MNSSKIAYKINKINLNLRLRILAPFHWFWLKEMFHYAKKREFEKRSSLLGNGENIQATVTHKTRWTFGIITQLSFLWFMIPVLKQVHQNNELRHLNSKFPEGCMLHGQKRLHVPMSHYQIHSFPLY